MFNEWDQQPHGGRFPELLKPRPPPGSPGSARAPRRRPFGRPQEARGASRQGVLGRFRPFKSDAGSVVRDGFRSDSAQSSGSTDAPLTPFSRSGTPAESSSCELERRPSWEVSMGKDGGFSGAMVDFVRNLRAGPGPSDFRRAQTAPLRSAAPSPGATLNSLSPATRDPSPAPDVSLPRTQTPRNEALPPVAIDRTQRWHWTRTTLKEKLRATPRPAKKRTWALLKQQRTKPQPAMPECQWALQVYRRNVYLREKDVEESTQTSLPSTVEARPEIVRAGSSRSLGSRRSSKGSDTTGNAERWGAAMSPLLSPSSASVMSAEEEEDPGPTSSSEMRRLQRPPFLSRAGDRSRKPSNNPPWEARAKSQSTPTETPAEEELAVVSTSTEARRNFDKRRSMYYQALEFEDDEEEESSSEEEEEDSDSDDGQEHDEARVEVFFQFQHHDELHRSDMVKALQAIGFICPQDTWINDAWKGVSPRFNMVDLDDFLAIVRAYEERQHLAFATAFRSCDKNGSGVVECSELGELLFHLNMEPMSHVLNEVISEVDTDGLGTLNLQEFKAIMQLILSREGFTKTEYEEFHAIFERYDLDKSGECNAVELAAILNWLGFAWAQDRLQAVLSEVDVDNTGSVNQREFIVCMRKVREEELQHVKQAMRDADRDGDGTMSKDEMPDLLKGLGYDPWDVKVIIEAQRRAGLQEEQELDLGQVWQVLQLYRRYEGFSEEECAKIAQLFDEQEKDETGELRCIDMPKALRALGYKLTFEVVQSIISKVDVDQTGSLNIVEFRKLIRMLQEREANHFRKVLRESGKGSPLSIQVAQDIAKAAGCQLEQRHFVLSRAGFEGEEDGKEVEPDDEITEDSFTRACCNYSQELRETFQKNGGFSNEEVSELRHVFESYDSRKTGKIANKELVRLVDNLCPSLAREKALRPQLQQMMQACQEFDGSLVFKDFLQLMRLVLDFQDKERAQRELAAIRSTGFTRQEVQDFRELFLQADEGFGVLPFDAVRAMIHSITPLGDNLVYQLQGIFTFVTRKKVQNGGGRAEEVDFSEFLLLMKQLLDINFAKLRDKTPCS